MGFFLFVGVFVLFLFVSVFVCLGLLFVFLLFWFGVFLVVLFPAQELGVCINLGFLRFPVSSSFCWSPACTDGLVGA